MRFFTLTFTTLACIFGLAPLAEAASLRVSPVVLDLQAPTAASAIRVWNDADRAINVQIRVFVWTQKDGEESYVAAKDVVASPPMATLRPGGENLIRIVRTSKRPVRAEESYRLVVDELPNPARRQGGTVTLVVRHSIPVFFAKGDAEGASPSWSVERRSNGYMLTVSNTGSKRLKLSNLTLNAGGSTIARREGLVGYVLGSSKMSWFVPSTGRGRASGSSVTVSAESEAGPFNATARLSGG